MIIFLNAFTRHNLFIVILLQFKNRLIKYVKKTEPNLRKFGLLMLLCAVGEWGRSFKALLKQYLVR